jgi:hypothetical protein
VLLDAGADVHYVDRSKKTALLHAAYKVNSQILSSVVTRVPFTGQCWGHAC